MSPPRGRTATESGSLVEAIGPLRDGDELALLPVAVLALDVVGDLLRAAERVGGLGFHGDQFGASPSSGSVAGRQRA